LSDNATTVPLLDWPDVPPLALPTVIRTVSIVLRKGATLCGNPDRCAEPCPSVPDTVTSPRIGTGAQAGDGPTRNPNSARDRQAISSYARSRRMDMTWTSRLLAHIGTAAFVVTAPLVFAALAQASPVRQDRWDHVAQCESGGNWRANTGNGYYGGLQFSSQTWHAYGGGAYAGTANQASRSQQIAIAEKVLRAQGWRAWPACSARVGLR
jgi:Transglycosylase-like domain